MDEVVREIPVVLSATPSLYLLQFPVTTHRFTAARVRPKNRMLELEWTPPTGKHIDPEAEQLERRKLNSSLVRPMTNYGCGLVKDGVLHLAPIHTTMQMRPDFSHIDECDEEKPKLAAVGLKRRGRDIAPQYAAKRAAQDAEPWTSLKVAQDDSPEADDIRARL